MRLRSPLLPLTLLAAACGGRPVPTDALPSSPVAAVEQFLAAANANDLATMGEVYGSKRGPVNYWMDATEREKRLTVIRSYLVHERYQVEPGTLPGNDQGQRIVRIQLVRNNCRPIVPFTVQQFRTGWLVLSFDIEAAGNPMRPCPAGPTR